jgi:hypothetical protein
MPICVRLIGLRQYPKCNVYSEIITKKKKMTNVHFDALMFHGNCWYRMVFSGRDNALGHSSVI